MGPKMNPELMSDAQVRAMLIELGHPVGPVTSSTRKPMVNKLKALLAAGARPPATSGEESDGGRLTPKARRRTMAPPKSGAKSPRRRAQAKPTIEPIASSTLLEPQIRAPRSGGHQSNHYLNNSDDIFLPPPSRQPPLNAGKYSPLNAQRINNEAFRASLHAAANSYGSSPVSPYSGNSYASSTPHSGHSYENSIDLAETRSNTPTDFTESPFASDFVRRLTAGRTKDMAYPTVSPGLSRKLLDVKESDDEDSGPPPNYTAKFSTGRASREPQLSASRGRLTSSDAWYLDSPISALLVVLFFLFFGSIGVVYVNKTSVSTSLTSETIDFRLCANDVTHIPDLNCIKEEDKTYVDLMIGIILQELEDQLALSSCSTNVIKLSDNDILNLIIRKDMSLSYWIVEKNINNLKIIFEANPQWRIKPTKDGIELSVFPSSLYCSALSYITIAANWVVRGSIAILALLAVYFGVRWWLRKEARHKEEVYRLVGSIIEIVSTKAAGSDNYIPVSHVRDQLIPLKDRHKTKRLWEDALKLLETDSRLRKEVIHNGGEEVVMWKWLASNLTTNKKKVWQGQAFDTLEGNLNSHVESPTNCLKIRHMFEPGQEEGDDWVTTVENAILEKCFNAKVLHLFVERQSTEGLVYMKCASPADAGVAYRALHGSWFASNLITVKYIREHRYHERFPDAVNASKPLRPSNDYMRSLK